MTAQEAKEIFKKNNAYKILDAPDEDKAAFNVTIWSLNKQIPKKPNYPNELQIKCPVCGRFVLDGQPYCDECGQALDWSD